LGEQVIALPCFAFVILLMLGWLAWRGIEAVVLKRRFQSKWGREERFILFVHSNSPVWAPYLAEHLFPELQHCAVFLNWSERSRWTKEQRLEARMFRHWGGRREFNPMAIVVPRRGRVRAVRFFKAFKSYKHHDLRSLHEAERKLRELMAAANDRSR
jgi:hypothetical protein